jgi:micrococcal nuclease
MRVGMLFSLACGAVLVSVSGCSLTPTPEGSPTTSPPGTTHDAAPATFVEARVIRTIDGETIEVSINGASYVVRYLGIDAPDLAEPFGADALILNRRMVEGNTVRLEKDVSDLDKDGRLLRYVYAGEVFVNAEMLRQGYARLSIAPPDTRYQDLFQRLERDARVAKMSIWTPTGTVSPTPTKKPTPNTEITIPPYRD